MFYRHQKYISGWVGPIGLAPKNDSDISPTPSNFHRNQKYEIWHRFLTSVASKALWWIRNRAIYRNLKQVSCRSAHYWPKYWLRHSHSFPNFIEGQKSKIGPQFPFEELWFSNEATYRNSEIWNQLVTRRWLAYVLCIFLQFEPPQLWDLSGGCPTPWKWSGYIGHIIRPPSLLALKVHLAEVGFFAELKNLR